jgi:hypothetical protein
VFFIGSRTAHKIPTLTAFYPVLTLHWHSKHNAVSANSVASKENEFVNQQNKQHIPALRFKAQKISQESCVRLYCII